MAPHPPPPYNFPNSDYSYRPTSIYQDRKVDKLKFINTNLGVKGWVDGYLSSPEYMNVGLIPAMFRYTTRIDLNSTSNNDSFIPIIDLSRGSSDDTFPLMPIISKAATGVGMFKIINHGMNVEKINRVLASVREFHESDPDDKKFWYKRYDNICEDDAGYYTGTHYESNFDIIESTEPAYWQDLLQVRLDPDLPQSKPSEFKLEDLIPFNDGVRQLAQTILANLSVGLGYSPNTLGGNTYSGRSALIGEYYPHCPQPDRTWGFRPHSASAMINIMFPGNSEIHVKHNNREWARVRNDPGTILVKIGELLQIVSNNVYKAGVHRVPANRGLNPQVAAFVPFTPGNREWEYEPPTRRRGGYKRFTFHEYNLAFYKATLGEYKMLKHFAA